MSLHSVPYTIEEIEDPILWGGELLLKVELDEGQRGQFHGPPERCCEEIPPSCHVYDYDILSATLMNDEGDTKETTQPLYIAQLKAWIEENAWIESETLEEELLEKISEQQEDAREAAAEAAWERKVEQDY